ncbi:MAG TPA: hypothetical protein VJA87_01415 [Candidatus Paceibacterota bacterium]
MWFSKPSGGSSAALIDISSSSVAGALVRLEEGKAPSLCYTVRIPLEGSGKDLTAEALHALEEVGNRLVREGAPALRATVGEGHVGKVLVSLGKPWQETTIETKRVQKVTPFTYTRSFTTNLLGPAVDVSGRSVTRTVIATLLNGYLTLDPYGKEAKRAEVIVLSTSLENDIVDSAEKILRSCFHTRDIRYTSFLEHAYHALQSLYPYEKDFILMSVTKDATEAISVKRGYLLDAGSISCGSRTFGTAKECVDSLSRLLREFAARHALPRTVFVLADEAEIVKGALSDSSLHALWLSDVPISTIPIQASHFSGMVSTQGFAEGDARLAMLALAAMRKV